MPISDPTNVTFTAGINEVDISWSAVTGATSYRVYRRNNAVGGTYFLMYDDTSTSFEDIVPSYTFTGTTPSAASYDYSVRAFDSATNDESFGYDDTVTMYGITSSTISSMDIAHPQVKKGGTTYTRSVSTTIGSATPVANDFATNLFETRNRQNEVYSITIG